MITKLFDQAILRSIGKQLLSREQSIAVAESVTSGLLQFSFSNMEDAQKFYHGGITAYNVGQKYKHLNVETLHALAVNCVSQKVAIEMAMNVATVFNSDWGIGITGYASPGPESGNKTFAYYAVSFRESIPLSGMLDGPGKPPPAVQLFYVQEVLSNFNSLITGWKIKKGQ